MSGEPSLRRIVAPMVERRVDVDGAAFRVDRQRILAGMSRAGRPGRRGWPALVALVAAACVAIGFGTRLGRHDVGAGASSSVEVEVVDGSAMQVRGPARSGVPQRERTRIVAAGDLQTAAASSARLTTQDGLKIELRSQTRVSLGDLQPGAKQVKLLGGGIRCTVPHRAASQAFQVVTPDATVVDLGTVFTVSLEGPNLITRISVEEGEVLVRHAAGQTRVSAPNSWSSAAVVAEPTASGGTGEVAASAPSPRPAPEARDTRLAPRAAGGADLPAATLALEAQLLRRGLAAERQGRGPDAVSALTQLIAQYPHSPLIPDARAALARVEASTPR